MKELNFESLWDKAVAWALRHLIEYPDKDGSYYDLAVYAYGLLSKDPNAELPKRVKKRFYFEPIA